MAPQKEVVLKLTAFRYRREGVSEEEFHEFSSSNHGPKAAIIQQRHGALRVEQYHTPTACRKLLLEKVPWATRPGWVMDDHDIQISVWVRTTEQMFNVIMDPDFQALVGEADAVIDNDKAHVVAGWVEVYVDEGKVVNIDEKGETMYSQPFAEKIKIGWESQVTSVPNNVNI